MYQAPEAFKDLIRSLREDLATYGANPQDATLLAQVELGLELLNLLALTGEPITVLWVLLSDLPLRHPQIDALNDMQRQAIAQTRLLLPGYAGRFGWEEALRDYAALPSEVRRYNFDVTRLEQQIFDNCRGRFEFSARAVVYRSCLTEQLTFQERRLPYAVAEQDYVFRAPTATQGARFFTVKFNDEQVEFANVVLPQLNGMPRQRQPFAVTWTELEATARFLDKKEGSNQWEQRLKQIRYRPFEENETGDLTLVLDGNTHLAGMVAAGKSTLMILIGAHVIRKYQAGHTSMWRVTLVVGDSSTSVQLADQFNRWFCNSPETDSAVAVPLLGRSTRNRHLKQLFASREYQMALAENRIHWGERFLNPICPLQGSATISLEALGEPLLAGTEPCQSLKPSSGNNETDFQKQSHLCPLFAVCPSQQVNRDMVTAQVWITTPGAMGVASLPTQMEPRRVKMGDLIYEQSDIVIFDEVDTIIEWFDRLYAQEIPLRAGGDGLLEQLDSETSRYWSENYPLPIAITRWIEAQRRFMTPVENVMALLSRPDSPLRTSVGRGYFTAHALFFRLARRLVGLKEYEDEQEPTQRQANERQVLLLMAVFESLLQMRDPLAAAPPEHFRGDRPVTLTALQRSRQNQDSLRDTLAYSLVLLMQQAMLGGNNAILQARCHQWVEQTIPDIEQRFEQLRQRLAQSEKSWDQHYLKEKQVDSLETISLRLAFALNAALLDRHTRLVFYEWHNRPAHIITQEQPYRRIPASLLNILPVPPTGRLFGIYHTAFTGNSASQKLSIFGYTNVGRHYVTNFHCLRTALDGQRGPNILAISGTSYLPDSTRWHYGIRPTGVLRPSEAAIAALQSSECWFRYLPLGDGDGQPIRVSGAPDREVALSQLAVKLVGDSSDEGGWLGDELRTLAGLAERNPGMWQDRGRLLLLVNSYDQCEAVANVLRSRWREMADRIYYLVPTEESDEENDEEETTGTAILLERGALTRVDIEQFGQMNGQILIAPLQAIGRGFNILNAKRKAAFGTIYFLTRPMPHPHDVSAIAQEINRRIYDWADDEKFAAWQGDGIYRRGLKLRQIAERYWRSVEERKFYSRLRDERDNLNGKAPNLQLHANPRRDLAATTAGKIIQAVGRLMRGNVPFHAYFVDAAWAPQQARRLMGAESVPLDTSRTSLLAAIIDVLADYIEDDVGEALYAPLLTKLEQTVNFDWEPTR